MKKPLHVLLVEDLPSDAELIVHELHRAGFDPRWTRVETERDYLSRLQPGLDLILSDYALPQFSGPRALELLRQNGLPIPFIVISGTIGEEMAVEAMKCGAEDYLIKGRLARLGPAIEQALAKNQLRREREQVDAALRNSERRFGDLLRGLPLAVYTTDTDGRILDYNPAAAALWGRGPALGQERWCGSPELLAADGKTLAREQSAMAVALREGRALNGVEQIVRRTDGTKVMVMSYPMPLRDSEGKVTSAVNVLVDITERRKLEEQLRQSQKMEAVGQLASGVAHDFNNLLTVIHGNASLLLSQGTDPGDVASSLQQIVQAAEHAASLTRQLLMFSRKQVMHLMDLDLNQILGQLIRLLERLVGENIALQFEPTPGLPLVHADVGMIEQLVMNLVVNARDAMPNGGTVKISLTEERLPEQVAGRGPGGLHVCLRVKDTGCGIPAEVLPRIFEPFFTTKEPGRGTGLGLATVYGIINQHHGQIKVSSEPGQGALFRVYLPALGPGAGVARSTGTQEAAGRMIWPGGQETILVVEDEPAVRLLVANTLKRCGYRVLQAVSGTTALQVWSEHQAEIELLLTDMIMPDGMSGWELARRLRSARPELKVIYTSGYSADLSRMEGTLGPDVRFLQKPYPPRQLAEMVRESLDGK